MKIEGTQSLTHPAAVVFRTLRDKTPDLVSILPNIEAMEVISREDAPPLVHLYNRWQGANKDVPRILRPFVSKDLLAWFDRALWNEEGLDCRWQIESVGGKDCFTCTGSTAISADAPDRSTLSIAGELRVDPDHVPGVPRFLARKLQEPLEHFIVGAMRPNLTSIALAVQQYLDRQQSSLPGQAEGRPR